MVPDLTLDNLRWRPADGGPVPLAVKGSGPATGREIGDAADAGRLDEAAALLSDRCVRGMAS